MKKLLFAVAAVMLLVSCGSRNSNANQQGNTAAESEAAPAQEESVSPVTQYLSLCDKAVKLAQEDLKNNREGIDDGGKTYEKLGKQKDEISKFVAKNKDYKLTDDDRKDLKSWLKKNENKLTIMEFDMIYEGTDQDKTLGDCTWWVWIDSAF